MLRVVDENVDNFIKENIMIKKKRTNDTPYKLSYNKYGNAKDYINTLEDLIRVPLDSLEMMDGDLYMSDYRKLREALWLIQNKDN